ncbi:hypothetical protein ACFL3D_00700 [Candidatus Omnitrophota bacterium]
MEPIVGINSIRNGYSSNVLTNESSIRERMLSVSSSLRSLAETLEGARNKTYSRTARQDRIIPANLRTKRTMLDPKDVSVILTGSSHMPRLKKGSFTINSTVISMDPSKDSFSEIVSRINSSTAGVHARYNAQKDALEISSRSGGKIEITEDSAHFLEEANIVLSTYEGTTGVMSFTLPGTSRNASDILSNIKGFVNAYNDVMNDASISQEIKDKIAESTNNFIAHQLAVSPSSKGLNVGDGSLYFDFSSQDNRAIGYNIENSFNVLRDNPYLLVKFFAGESGYSNKVNGNVSQALSELELDQTGENINISV